MIVILLGILDLLAGFSIFTLHFTWGPPVVWFFVLYLLAKSLPFLKSVASVLDLLVAIIFIAAIMGFAHPIVNVLAALWLIQKGVISFF